jgi:anti-sigma factor RsiW
MPCLTADRIYDYLDGALSAAEREDLERHLAGCAACRCALDVRRKIAGAAAGLPDAPVPDDFAAGIMAKVAEMPVYAPKKAVRRFFWAAGGAAAVLASVLGLYAFWTDQGVLALLQRWGGGFVSCLQTTAGAAAKGLKLLLLGGKIIAEVSSQALSTLQSVASMMGPEARIVVAGGALVILLSGGAFLRRRNAVSEKPHHEEE